MNLIIDIGNTRIKAALFKGNDIFSEFYIDPSGQPLAKYLITYADELENCILASVAESPEFMETLLNQRFKNIIRLDSGTPLPFKNKYRSKNTLGHDRIAGIAGACWLYPGKDVLVIDAGTAITYDLKTRLEEYLGGNISPGLSIRFKALHDYTSRLPLLSPLPAESLLGNTTSEAIISGVQSGLVYEVNGYIEELGNKYPGLVVILTGGDEHFFDNKLKKTIFVVSNLTLIGLNYILQYNAKKD